MARPTVDRFIELIEFLLTGDGRRKYDVHLLHPPQNDLDNFLRDLNDIYEWGLQHPEETSAIIRIALELGKGPLQQGAG